MGVPPAWSPVPVHPHVVMAGLGWLPAPWALAIAGGLLLLRTRTGPGRWGSLAAAGVQGQVALMLGLYAVWQYAGALTVDGLGDPRRAGLGLAHLEAAWGWPSEAAIQRPVLDHDWVMRAADTYYAVLHVPVLLATVGWVLVRHRGDWPFVRSTLVLLTGACLLVQYRPVAPPRLLPELGVTDTALRSGLSVYGPVAGGSQFGAMPSVHMAWAAAAALFVVIAASSRWRWLAVAYPVVTLWVVVVTGNHFIVDGLAAVVLLVAAAGLTLLIPSQRPARITGRAEASAGS